MAIVAPRESTRAQLLANIDEAINTQQLTRAQAAKVRGRARWLASNCYGRVGRVGMTVLKELQYATRRGARLTEDELSALAFFAGGQGSATSQNSHLA